MSPSLVDRLLRKCWHFQRIYDTTPGWSLGPWNFSCEIPRRPVVRYKRNDINRGRFRYEAKYVLLWRWWANAKTKNKKRRNLCWTPEKTNTVQGFTASSPQSWGFSNKSESGILLSASVFLRYYRIYSKTRNSTYKSLASGQHEVLHPHAGMLPSDAVLKRPCTVLYHYAPLASYLIRHHQNLYLIASCKTTCPEISKRKRKREKGRGWLNSDENKDLLSPQLNDTTRDDT